VAAREAGGYGPTAQWDDDVRHALLTGERQGYYADFGGLDTLATVLRGAYFHAGTWSSFRRRVRGRPVDRGRVPGYRFVVCLQNHDQIGNRGRCRRRPAGDHRPGGTPRRWRGDAAPCQRGGTPGAGVND
jgi:1,4-alpha-glucan branching enzyme